MQQRNSRYCKRCVDTYANLDRQAVDKTIRSYVTLLRSGNDVLAYCIANRLKNDYS
ncbi:hypothetical protein [Symbiopectobacterium sp. RP]|uniref:hypothetical protein n=1 Tax=Symbiopectobacterium sp. RP TaxID=3248553 RepID=UPI003D27DAED